MQFSSPFEKIKELKSVLNWKTQHSLALVSFFFVSSCRFKSWDAIYSRRIKGKKFKMAWNNQGSFIRPPYCKLWFLKLRSCIRFPFLIHADFLTPFLFVPHVVMVLRPGGFSWVNFCWVCAAGISEPLPHYSLFCSHLSHFEKKVIFVIPT